MGSDNNRGKELEKMYSFLKKRRLQNKVDNCKPNPYLRNYYEPPSPLQKLGVFYAFQIDMKRFENENVDCRALVRS